MTRVMQEKVTEGSRGQRGRGLGAKRSVVDADSVLMFPFSPEKFF